MVLSKDKSTLYACTTDGLYCVSKYVRNVDKLMWEKESDLPRSEKDDVESMLQLKLDKHDKVLFGKEFYAISKIYHSESIKII